MSTASAEFFAVQVPARPAGAPPPTPAVEVRATYRGVTTQARFLFQEQPRRRRAERRTGGRHFTIGSDAGVDAPVADSFLPWASHPLVMAAGGDYVVNVTPRMTGEVDDDGRVVSLGDYVRRKGACFPLPASGSARLACGAMTFIVARTHPPRALPPPALRWNWDEQVYRVGSLLALLGLVVLMGFIPSDPKSLSLDLLDSGRRFLPFVIKAPEREEPTAPPAPPGGTAAGSKGAREKGPEGAMGDRAAKRVAARHAIAGPNDNPEPRLAKLRAIEAAKTAGILGLFRAVEGSHIASVFGADTALGRDAENVLGDLVSDPVGGAYGIGGLGVVGTGASAGGTREGVLGTGADLNTVGSGDHGNGSRGRYGVGVGPLHGRQATAPRWLTGDPNVRGSLDKEIVRRVIRLHLNEIKYCYERELAKHPTLGGRIVVQFAISPAGQVISSAMQSSTMKNAAVENCTVQAVRRWPFPKPTGGGLVMVSYPFVLAPAGG